jgi:hypothetical protein
MMAVSFVCLFMVSVSSMCADLLGVLWVEEDGHVGAHLVLQHLTQHLEHNKAHIQLGFYTTKCFIITSHNVSLLHNHHNPHHTLSKPPILKHAKRS